MRRVFLTFVFLFWVGIAITQAQSLPNVQQHSLRPPSDIKIDGKATEWHGKFQAHNNATNIYYSLCNDDNNLYLVIQANDPDVLTKITNRGISLTIYPTGKKTEKDKISIIYPVFDLQYGNKPNIRFSNAGGLTANQRAAIASNPDSILMVANKKLHDSEKYIRTSGIPEVDTLISVYNDQGIVAREGFEKGMVYTYELSLPIKYLNISAVSPEKIPYHIIIEGINIGADYGMKVTTMPDGTPLVSFSSGSVMVSKDHLPVVTSATDFWGEYTLAKKP